MTPRSSTMSGVVLDAPDGTALAGFYRDLLHWTVVDDEDGGASVTPDVSAGRCIACRTAADYRRPVWPPRAGERPGPMLLDIEVADLERAVAHAEAVGAVQAGYQPQRNVRVMLDPAGHPFCLYLDAAHT